MAASEAVVTEQQGVQILIQKETPNGKVEALEPSKVQWSYSDDNIARLDGDRLAKYVHSVSPCPSRKMIPFSGTAK
mgnify:CR=1 FL=1